MVSAAILSRHDKCSLRRGFLTCIPCPEGWPPGGSERTARGRGSATPGARHFTWMRPLPGCPWFAAGLKPIRGSRRSGWNAAGSSGTPPRRPSAASRSWSLRRSVRWPGSSAALSGPPGSSMPTCPSGSGTVMSGRFILWPGVASKPGGARSAPSRASGGEGRLLAARPLQLLERLRHLLESGDPDLLLTDWGDDLLLPGLVALAGTYGVELPLDREPPSPYLSPEGRGEEVRGIGWGRAAVVAKSGRQAVGGAGRSYLSYGRVLYRGPASPLRGRWHVDRRASFFFGETGLEGLLET